MDSKRRLLSTFAILLLLQGHRASGIFKNLVGLVSKPATAATLRRLLRLAGAAIDSGASSEAPRHIIPTSESFCVRFIGILYGCAVVS